MSSGPGFDLVNEQWIPVLLRRQVRRLSLRECLLNAHEIDALAMATSLETVAVLRQVLLPVWLDAAFAEPGIPLPRDEEAWEAYWQRGRLDSDRVGSYLTRFSGRFQLFGDRPFAQAEGLRTEKNETRPVSVLIASAASGNNVPLYSARTESDPPELTPGQAAVALLTAQCWDTAGTKTGAVGDPKVRFGKTTARVGPLGSLGVVVPLGRNLAETLLLHTPFRAQPLRRDDRPQWRTEPADETYPGQASWSERPALGLLDLLTWQSRRIRLIPEATADGRVVVRRAVLAAGDRLATIPHDDEPHTAWKLAEKGSDQKPVLHAPGRAAWRGLEPLLAVGDTSAAVTTTERLRQIGSLRVQGCLPESFPLQVLTAGVKYGTQWATTEDVIGDQIPLPVAALDPSGPVCDLLDRIIGHAEALRVAVNRLSEHLREAAGWVKPKPKPGQPHPWDRGTWPGDLLMIEFAPVVLKILARLQAAPGQVDEAVMEWRNVAWRLAVRVADPVLAAAPPRAFLGRQTDDGYAYRVSVAEARYRSAIYKILGPRMLASAATEDGDSSDV